MKFSFEHIEFLPALAIVPLLLILFIFVVRRKKYVVKKLGNPVLVKSLMKNYSPANFFLKFFFLLLAITATVLALMNLQKPGQSANIKRAGVDVMIAIDVSKSMLATDSKPNRLEKARQLVYKLMDELKDDRIGLVLFAGRAYLQMPLTTDHSAARMYVQNASPDVIPTQGTIFSEALRVCNSGYNSKERKFKSIVLISDGEDHDPEALKTAASLAENGVMINTVGIGSPEGSNIIDPSTDTYKTDAQGQPVLSKLNEPLLQQMAASTKGIYSRLDNVTESVKALKDQINTIEKTTVDDSTFRDYDSYFYWFVAAAILFLVLEQLWPERKWKIA